MHLLVSPQAVMSGVQDIVIAAGVEHMTSVPIGSNVADSFKAGHGKALFVPSLQCR
jgi:acetyl-CoA C-acetyltransferase